MPTTTSDYIDPFEGARKIIEEINKSLASVQAVSKSLKVADDLIKANALSMASAILSVEKSLSTYKSYQPQILDTLNRITESNKRMIEAAIKINSVWNSVNAEAIANLSLTAKVNCIKSLQSELPVLLSSIEKIKTEDETITAEKEEPTETKIKTQKVHNTKYIVEYIAAVVTILQFLLGLVQMAIPEININITNDYSVNYYIEEVNNFYVNQDVNTKDYNESGYRFVSEETIMPRVKPDCKSTVVDKLPLGKVVLIVDKYKKWVQIRWKNADDTFSYGWVQNYKLSEFKE